MRLGLVLLVLALLLPAPGAAQGAQPPGCNFTGPATEAGLSAFIEQTAAQMAANKTRMNGLVAMTAANLAEYDRLDLENDRLTRCSEWARGQIAEANQPVIPPVDDGTPLVNENCVLQAFQCQNLQELLPDAGTIASDGSIPVQADLAPIPDVGPIREADPNPDALPNVDLSDFTTNCQTWESATLSQFISEGEAEITRLKAVQARGTDVASRAVGNVAVYELQLQAAQTCLSLLRIQGR
jgi:hypothetical protein